MRFEIAEETKRWSLKDALFKKIVKEELSKAKKCPVGELFSNPLIIYTPRNSFRYERLNIKY